MVIVFMVNFVMFSVVIAVSCCVFILHMVDVVIYYFLMFFVVTVFVVFTVHVFDIVC